MKLLLLSVLLLSMASVSFAEVSARVYLTDANTPFDYTDIMLGTKLTIVIDSNIAEEWAGGYLVIEGAEMTQRGILSAKDGGASRLPAAGNLAVQWPTTYPGDGFTFWGIVEASPGDWFIIDYEAIDLGDCSVMFYDHGISLTEPVEILSFQHVRTRDFDNSTNVDFTDFAIFAAAWLAPDCEGPGPWEGADLDASGALDSRDLMLFADYWLKQTEYPFHQLRTRDFDNSSRVDFADFAILASYWQRPSQQQGIDLDFSGAVDGSDLMLFTEHWLQRTE